MGDFAMRYIKVLGFIAASVPALAFAGVQVLGFELGVNTLEQVKTQLTQQIGKLDAGTSNITGGPQLRTNGAGYGVDGITGVSYIFGTDQKLVGVVMDISKTHFNDTYDALSAKYQPAAKQRPGAGALFAKFEATDGTIELDGRHQGLDMQARYFSNDIYQKYARQMTEEDQQKGVDLFCCIDP
jgi:hypothetical protein